MPSYDFSSRDFDTIRSDLITRAGRVLPEWTDRDPSDFGMLMIDLWASVADVLHFYIDRVAGEAFLPTATQRESVLALANLFDYVPRGRSSAQALLTLRNDSAVPITVAPMTEFIARFDSTTYHAYTPLGGTAPSAGTLVLGLQEGSIFVADMLTTTASGAVGQRYTLPQEHIVASSIQVFVYENGVDPVEYLQVSRLTLAKLGDRAFTVNVTPNGDVEVVFGTNLNGFIPPARSKITATYGTSSGSSGNLPVNSVSGFQATTPQGITVGTSTAFTGGVDEESIASLKRSIPAVISAQSRAVTRNDFINMALQVAGVTKASLAFVPGSGVGASASNASVTIFPQEDRSVDYLKASSGSIQTVSAPIRSDVATALQARALLGVDVVCASTITWTLINITATVYVNERFVSNWVNRDVRNALDELFAFGNVFFGQRVTLGQVYRIILNVPGVDYANVTVFSTGLSGTPPDILVTSISMPKKGTVSLIMSGGITVS